MTAPPCIVPSTCRRCGFVTSRRNREARNGHARPRPLPGPDRPPARRGAAGLHVGASPVGNQDRRALRPGVAVVPTIPRGRGQRQEPHPAHRFLLHAPPSAQACHCLIDTYMAARAEEGGGCPRRHGRIPPRSSVPGRSLRGTLCARGHAHCLGLRADGRRHARVDDLGLRRHDRL